MCNHALKPVKCYSFLFFLRYHLRESSQHSIWKSQKKKVLSFYLCCQPSITVREYLRLPTYKE